MELTVKTTFGLLVNSRQNVQSLHRTNLAQTFSVPEPWTTSLQVHYPKRAQRMLLYFEYMPNMQIG